MSLNVDNRTYPAFWTGFSALVTRLMKQGVTGKITLLMHQGMIKGVEVDRVYVSLEELAKYERPV